ncbi:rod shape-determining protein MreD [Sedimentibacter sp.]|uniref:rod shape-determining protein MreD n=1 Tax=Sedimentibacter sp. TaxID=1960295 RepID=UPI00289E4380|nr:rod shape-determining protein MreD [Sedimentibacter sp.]
MRKFSLMAVVIILSFIIQTSLSNFFAVFNTTANLSLTVLVVFAMMSNGIVGAIIGLFTGMLYDAMIYDVFGVYTLIYFIIGAVIGNYSEDMIREKYVAYTTVTGISTVVMHFSLYVILFFLRYRVSYAGSIISNIFIETILNMVLVVFVLKFMNFLFDKLSVK